MLSSANVIKKEKKRVWTEISYQIEPPKLIPYDGEKHLRQIIEKIPEGIFSIVNMNTIINAFRAASSTTEFLSHLSKDFDANSVRKEWEGLTLNFVELKCRYASSFETLRQAVAFYQCSITEFIQFYTNQVAEGAVRNYFVARKTTYEVCCYDNFPIAKFIFMSRFAYTMREERVQGILASIKFNLQMDEFPAANLINKLFQINIERFVKYIDNISDDDAFERFCQQDFGTFKNPSAKGKAILDEIRKFKIEETSKNKRQAPDTQTCFSVIKVQKSSAQAEKTPGILIVNNWMSRLALVLSEPTKKNIFPKTKIGIILDAFEKSGSLEEMLNSLSNYYNYENARKYWEALKLDFCELKFAFEWDFDDLKDAIKFYNLPIEIFVKRFTFNLSVNSLAEYLQLRNTTYDKCQNGNLVAGSAPTFFPVKQKDREELVSGPTLGT